MSGASSAAVIASTSNDYAAITTGSSPRPSIDTSKFFDPLHQESLFSPLDRFIQNTDNINLILLNQKGSNELYTLVLLGYMSAIESYMRSIIRGVINIDEYSQRRVESKTVPFGVVVHQNNSSLLPEALLERISFASSGEIKSSLSNLIDIDIEKDMKSHIEEYNKICELRHCCVHRFGKLGAYNAISLGLINHKSLLEKPLLLDDNQIQDILFFLRSFVAILNSTIWSKLLYRTVAKKTEYATQWQWKYPSDRRRFANFYNLFASTLNAPASPAPVDMYNRFRIAFSKFKN